MYASVSEEGDLGRVSSVSPDRQRVWIRLTSGSTVTATNLTEPFDFVRDEIVFVTSDEIQHAPSDAWPHSEAKTAERNDLWVGIVSLREEDVTLINLGSSIRRVPTNDAEYEVGNTVEGTDASGVSRVLSAKPIRFIERPEPDVDDIAEFRHEPAGDVNFSDFGGLPAVVERARELIELPLAHHQQLRTIGAKPIKGVLFTGPPGTGKTMLARIIANVANATFYEVSGPAVISKWVGESEQILRLIFADAARCAPSIIFFDEIDSVAGRRTEEAHEASKRVVAQLLTLLDGFQAADRVTVIAATNRPQDIDVALRRPGRFDWEIDFPMPGIGDREDILRVSAKGLVVDDPLPYQLLAAETEGWSAADLAAIWREAALLAVDDHQREIIMVEDVLAARERVEAHRRRIDAAAAEAET